MIPILSQTASWAFVPTVPKYFGYVLAACACLGSPTGIDGHELRTGFLALVLQHAQEAAPGDIADCPAKLAALDHRIDVQALDNDTAKGTDQFTGDLEVMLAPLVGDARVKALQPMYSLVPILAAPLLARNGALDAAQFGERLLQVARIRLGRAIRVREEASQAHVDSDARQVARLDHNVLGNAENTLQDVIRRHLEGVQASLLSAEKELAKVERAILHLKQFGYTVDEMQGTGAFRIRPGELWHLLTHEKKPSEY